MDRESVKNGITESVKNGITDRISKFNPKRKEGKVAKAIEAETSRIPSDVFLWTSVGLAAGSLVMKALGRRHDALFIGQWAAPFLLLGLYNKIVKVQGHDRYSNPSPSRH